MKSECETTAIPHSLHFSKRKRGQPFILYIPNLMVIVPLHQPGSFLTWSPLSNWRQNGPTENCQSFPSGFVQILAFTNHMVTQTDRNNTNRPESFFCPLKFLKTVTNCYSHGKRILTFCQVERRSIAHINRQQFMRVSQKMSAIVKIFRDTSTLRNGNFHFRLRITSCRVSFIHFSIGTVE